MADLIYLDCNATAPIAPEVADAVRDAALSYPGNPASQHRAGREARRALDDAKERIGELLGARIGGPQGDRIILTSGGTEANNLALRGFAATVGERRCRLITSDLEHASVAEVAHRLARIGWQIERLPVFPDGQLDLNAVAPTPDVVTV
ncbi:MAG: aminotransferase class V-fold PLP-dependent enzyme, partial [Planctomycetales bacterium]|nr:aminotransferase class V-fold PLP-dependent enzyme [Planctomycetales bacterium]